MNQQIKERWLAALRSGDYVQGKGRLVTEGDGRRSYCCLGVLCEVVKDEAGLEFYPADENTDAGSGYRATESGIRDAHVLPSVVQRLADLHEYVPHIKAVRVPNDNEMATTLAFANDQGLTFLQIADIIEEEL